MNQFDVIVLGGGQAGRLVAETLAREGQKTGFITFNDDSATTFEQTVLALWNGAAPPEPDFHGPPGVETFRGDPVFENPSTLRVSGQTLTAKTFVLTPGSVPAIPNISGILETKYALPLEFIRSGRKPGEVGILGSGPVAAGMTAYALTHGIKPTVFIKGARLLPLEEEEISEFVARDLEGKGATLFYSTDIKNIRSEGNDVCLVFEGDDRQERKVNELILCAGFRPNSQKFDLEKANVYVSETGRVVIDDRMRTSNPRFWAAGTVSQETLSLALELQQAESLANNVLSPFFSQLRLEDISIPQVFPTMPRVARVGKKSSELNSKKIQTVIIQREEKGQATLLKLIGHKKTGKILGVNAAGPLAEGALLALHPAMRAEIPMIELWERREYPSHGAGALVEEAMRKWLEEE